MSDDENARHVGFPKPRALPPCLVGAHNEECDSLCAEVAKNTGMEVAQCGCPCHGREVASDPLAQARAEVQRLTAELALKDQALNEIKALHFETPCLCGPFGLPSGHPSCAACADDGWPCETLRVLTRLDTQGETK